MTSLSLWNPIDPFNGLDPLKKSPSAYGVLDLAGIVGRARRLLRGRTDDHVYRIAETIKEMIEQYFEAQEEEEIERQLQPSGTFYRYLPDDWPLSHSSLRWLFDQGLSTDALIETEHNTPENCTEINALKECISAYNLDVEGEVPAARACEYFAVLSLQLAGYALAMLALEVERRKITVHKTEGPPERVTLPPDTASSERFTRDLRIATTVALECMEALCYAEQLQAIEAHQAKLAQTKRVSDLEGDLLVATAEKSRGEAARLRTELRQLQLTTDSKAAEKAAEIDRIKRREHSLKMHEAKSKNKDSTKAKIAAMTYYDQHLSGKTFDKAIDDLVIKYPAVGERSTMETCLRRHRRLLRGADITGSLA